MCITKVELLPIRPQNGLMAFACVEIDHQFYVNSIGVHKRRDGKGYRITYPTRKVGEQNLTIFHPTEPSLSKEIEEAICSKAEEVMGL
ncbi:septation protein SpoVG family protein [Parachlamydia sp.]|uniref:septation protein SpoVG family protein n=1 Tax=Parachlamydia sp. TaxID=2052048 RepID=UPI003D15146E